LILGAAPRAPFQVLRELGELTLDTRELLAEAAHVTARRQVEEVQPRLRHAFRQLRQPRARPIRMRDEIEVPVAPHCRLDGDADRALEAKDQLQPQWLVGRRLRVHAAM
jgi:hypothetical protein